MSKEAEVAILDRAMGPALSGLSMEAARAILAVDFADSDRDHMTRLAEKARAGTLTKEEDHLLDGYIRLGHVLGILHSRARQALRNSNGA